MRYYHTVHYGVHNRDGTCLNVVPVWLASHMYDILIKKISYCKMYMEVCTVSELQLIVIFRHEESSHL